MPSASQKAVLMVAMSVDAMAVETAARTVVSKVGQSAAQKAVLMAVRMVHLTAELMVEV